jgi:hypothetical protein
MTKSSNLISNICKKLFSEIFILNILNILLYLFLHIRLYCKILINTSSCMFGIWLMPIWYLAHAYLVFGSCLFERTSEGIWWKLARAKYNWIILNLRTSENRTTEISRSQGPSVFIHKKNMALCTWGQLWESMGCIILCCKVKK